MKENKDVPTGGDAVGGSAASYETGGWRKLQPILDRDKCIDCLICWIMCPDTAIVVEDGKMVGFDMRHCKGCGICDDVCPDKVKAIKMEEEHS